LLTLSSNPSINRRVTAASGAFQRVVHGPQFSLWSGWLD
jgi:hypothetical protein